MKKTIYGLLLAAVTVAILFLTFQDAPGTVKLSESVRLWFESFFGIKSSYHSFRSNAHLVEYFILGVVLSLYGLEAGWRWWMILLVGAGFGLMDEGIKVLLPTREFDAIDLIKDLVGVTVGVSIVTLIDWRPWNGKRKIENSHDGP